MGLALFFLIFFVVALFKTSHKDKLRISCKNDKALNIMKPLL